MVPGMVLLHTEARCFEDQDTDQKYTEFNNHANITTENYLALRRSYNPATKNNRLNTNTVRFQITVSDIASIDMQSKCS